MDSRSAACLFFLSISNGVLFFFLFLSCSSGEMEVLVMLAAGRQGLHISWKKVWTFAMRLMKSLWKANKKKTWWTAAGWKFRRTLPQPRLGLAGTLEAVRVLRRLHHFKVVRLLGSTEHAMSLHAELGGTPCSSSAFFSAWCSQLGVLVGCAFLCVCQGTSCRGFCDAVKVKLECSGCFSARADCKGFSGEMRKIHVPLRLALNDACIQLLVKCVSP